MASILRLVIICLTLKFAIVSGAEYPVEIPIVLARVKNHTNRNLIVLHSYGNREETVAIVEPKSEIKTVTCFNRSKDEYSGLPRDQIFFRTADNIDLWCYIYHSLLPAKTKFQAFFAKIDKFSIIARDGIYFSEDIDRTNLGLFVEVVIKRDSFASFEDSSMRMRFCSLK